MKPLSKPGRNYAIDLLKAISILYIVGYWHLFNYTNAFPMYKNDVTSRLTIILLGLFTFLSGYLIGRKEEFHNIQDVIRYYSKKILRIYPLYFLAIILFYILKISAFNTLLKATFFLSMFYPPAPLTLWFIAMIFNFYLIAPLFIKLKNKTISFVITGLFIIVLLIIYSRYTGNLDYRIIIYFPAFTLGILTASKEKFFAGIKPFIYLIIFAISLSAAVFTNFDSKEISMLMRIPMVLSGSLALFFMARNLKNQPLQALITKISYASFCILLFHRPVYQTLKTLYFPGNTIYQVIYLLVICLPIAIIISWSIQQAYDLLNQKLKKN